uniref:TFIIS-type domain-containing protein n=1 Tax=viral metagenome TaxID=1070528 RepID=A0A6C0C796_9ZZZZ
MNTIVEFYVPEKLRKEYLKQFQKIFSDKAVNVEEGAYKYTKQFCGNDQLQYCAVYIDKCKDILYNCEKRKTNEGIAKFVNDIKEGKYNGYNLAFLQPEEFDPDSWSKILKRKQTTEEKMKNLPTITWKPCKNCKCTQYFFSQMQTRSADEPMTRYYDCKECNQRYKICN